MVADVLRRVFSFKERELEDPNPDWNIQQVKEFYSGQFPELVNSTHTMSVDPKGNIVKYELKTKIGTKG